MWRKLERWRGSDGESIIKSGIWVWLVWYDTNGTKVSINSAFVYKYVFNYSAFLRNVKYLLDRGQHLTATERYITKPAPVFAHR